MKGLINSLASIDKRADQGLTALKLNELDDKEATSSLERALFGKLRKSLAIAAPDIF
jgi:hypothetical protein